MLECSLLWIYLIVLTISYIVKLIKIILKYLTMVVLMILCIQMLILTLVWICSLSRFTTDVWGKVGVYIHFRRRNHDEISCIQVTDMFGF